MTNITYFSNMVRDDSTSSDQENSEVPNTPEPQEANLVHENLEGSKGIGGKTTFTTVIGKALFGCARATEVKEINLASLGNIESGTFQTHRKCDDTDRSERTSSETTPTTEEKSINLASLGSIESTGTFQAHRKCGDRGRSERTRLETMPTTSRSSALSEVVASGWPSWLWTNVPEAIMGRTPRQAETYDKLDKIGQGVRSNVYKARDNLTGKIVALKKVRFDTDEPESVKCMAREILILRRLDHPNVVKLEGLAISRMRYSLILVFEYMEHNLADLARSSGMKFTVPQVKCFMHQILSGLEHCHNRGVLHRDINVSNLLLTNGGVLKIAGFGSASFFEPSLKQPLTSLLVTPWYGSPELLLGSSNCGEGVDLWSMGCVLSELLVGKPIIPGGTEVNQLEKIFKLCGSPPEEFWKTLKLRRSKPSRLYRPCIAEILEFENIPPSSLPLIQTLLSSDPDERQTASAALKSEFFRTEPHACDPSSFAQRPPDEEIHVIQRGKRNL